MVTDIRYDTACAVVTVSGPITEGDMLQFVATLEQLHREYAYQTIEINVCSPGGEVRALDYCVEAMDALRHQGVRFTTRALMSVSSAAACLVSLGDSRVAAPSASFLYHQARTLQAGAVTASLARHILTNVDATDEQYLTRLTQRARRDNGQDCPVLPLTAFTVSDWPIVEDLLVSEGILSPRAHGASPCHKTWLSQLRQHVTECRGAPDEEPLKRFYRRLLAMDRPISAALALTLHLVDRFDGAASIAPSAPPVEALHIPEWAPLYRPDGRVPRKVLCRHTLVLGETGSGKTVSGVLPVMGALLAPGNCRVGCALIIDPKRELLSHVVAQAPEDLNVEPIDLHSAERRPILNLMASEGLSVAGLLAQAQYLEAAKQILVRAASLSPDNPARVLAGLSTTTNVYWNKEGSALAVTALGLVLLILEHRQSLYGDGRTSGWLTWRPLKDQQALLDFGAAAGVIEYCPKLHATVIKTHQQIAALECELEEEESDEDKDNEAGILTRKQTPCNNVRHCFDRFVGEVTASELYQSSPEFSARIDEAIQTALSRYFLDEDGHPAHDPGDCVCGVAYLVHAVNRAYARVVSDETMRPAPNILALANRALADWLSAGVGKEQKLPVMPIIELLKNHVSCEAADEIYRKVETGWNPMAMLKDSCTYVCIASFARNCFSDFADGPVARSLFFGVEPYYHSLRTGHGDGQVLLAFDEAINSEDARTVYVFQPRLDNGETLLVRALKATYFEAILNSRKRQQRGESMPLAAYIVDECHRFITADKTHGEQSFLDTCRSFGVLCVLACQSLSSLEHALAENSPDAVKNRAALDIMLNNTANKLFFRSTDLVLQATLNRLCPVTPGLPPLTQVRPPSTLQPGECYASLATGHFVRRQLLPFQPTTGPGGDPEEPRTTGVAM